ncbi:related to SSM4 - Ubiquitin-protein ligase involved in ER-associated protein degradation [Ustilago trichophora]|uniref:RING-type E3 ubiquitin transferase n=1 Tax=Ustilago trichophora TaxID=86804 RepID=A0A5C3EPB4_9BASI|nr:related to SSM4 - Ubiquitin-protein ligase involved in ER-associated protein degradation [Ustilago trichophora]
MEDEDSCRICRSGPEPGAPLYHPCKCTGSIRYCHQECLVEWLQHSRKKYCELCNHPFIFHKKYRKDMPSDGNLPRYLYVRRLVIRAVQITQLAARALLVGFTWLALLPYININVWRFMFWSIDVATWMGVPGSVAPFDIDAPPANHSASASLASATAKSTTDPQHTAKFSGSFGRTRNGSAFQAATLGHAPISLQNAKAALRSFTKKLAHDCFEGQILSCVIVVFFVGVFLLREWILQNIPQNFDNPPVADAVPPPRPPANAAAVRPLVPPEIRPQILADFEQRHDELELDPLFARLPGLDAEQPPAGAADAQEPAQGHPIDLDIDPDEQREQARQARIRHLEQMFANLAGNPLETRFAEYDDQENEDNDPEDQSAANFALSQPEQRDRSEQSPGFSSTQNLQDVLGWSEQGAHLQDVRSSLDTKLAGINQGPSQSGASSSTNAVSGQQPIAINVAAEPQHEQRQEEPTGPNQLDPVASSTYTAPAETPLAPHSSQATPAAADAMQGEPVAQAETAPAPNTTATDDIADQQANDRAGDSHDDDDAWEDESDVGNDPVGFGVDARDEAELRAAAAAAFPPPIAHPAVDDEIEIGIAAEGDDPEAEIGLAEEMDGILEAIGMRGPIFGIVQNLFLMMFLCGFVMLAFVMAPYIVGRALGSGPGLIKLLALPVKVLRYVTDPVFDSLIALGANSVWPKIAAAVGMQSASGQNASMAVSDAASASAVAQGWMQKFLPSMLRNTAAKNVTTAARQVLGSPVAAKTSATAAMLVRLLPESVTTSSQWKAVSDSFDVALATGLRGSLYRIGDHVSAFFVRLDAHRVGNSSTDRAFCVAFGHFYWLLILFVHQHFSKPDLQRALADQSALKMFMDQHVLIIKAISFIFIELVVFPLGCGLLFDVCTMPFLAEASIALWPEKVRIAPLSFAFTRWMGGTIYMFVFAQYVSATRKVLRPGVLCWIRDPNDPSFHPIREILDKRSLTQLRKIGASAVMYAAILVASVGVNTYFLRYAMGWTGLLPLRWTPFDPLTEVPIDLLMAHFALPWATQRIDPEKISEKWLKAWWVSTSRALRLSSYMIGGEFEDERRKPRGNAVVAAVRAIVHGTGATEGDHLVEDGQLCRVPADDKAITSGPLIIPLQPDGTPPTERLAEAISKQETDAEKHNPKPTYTNIYLPSNYRFRITTILTLLWLSHCALFILGLGIPLLVGRVITSTLKGKDVHDFYSYTIGLTLLMVTFKIVRVGRRMWVARVRRARTHRTSPGMYILVHVLVKIKRIFKALFLLIGVAGFVPLVVGLLVEQYVLVPLRYRSTEIPVLNVGQIWACGMLEARLALFAARFFGGVATNTTTTAATRGVYARFMDNVDIVVRGGLYPRPKVRVAWRRVVLPVMGVGSALLFGPVALAHLMASKGWVQVNNREEEQLLLRKIFGTVQSIILVTAVRAVIRRRMDSWTDLLKDEVFLESTELKNYSEPTSRTDRQGKRGTAQRTTSQVVADEAGEWVEDQGEGEEGEEEVRGDLIAEGTLPDVLFR